MVSARRGAGALGCLVPLLLLSVAAYFGLHVGEAYWRYFRYRDAMQQEVRFADRNSDALILQRLRSVADSLGLPDAARDIELQRRQRRISISATYAEHVELPLHLREFRFHPHAEGPF